MTAVEAPPIASPGADQPVWRNSHFMKLWIAQGVSQTIQNLTFFALMVYVERETRSTTHMAALVISTILPAVLFGVTAGVFVDRWNKRVVLVATNALRAIAVLGYLFIFAGNLTLEQAFLIFYGLNFVFSTISQFFLPAEGAMVPFLVGRDRLIAANGFLNITFSASQVLGFLILGPPLVGAFGAETVLIGIAVTYVFCALLLTRLPNDRSVTTGERRGVFSGVTEEIVAGWRLLRGDAAISLAMVHLTVATTVMLILGALAPGFTNRALGLGPEFTVVIFG
ncbi:MAG: MFS transporter, partial [Dehalococcoidia bacterium]|nr:MFS transporter [Dehalococcoidia bacterium]